MMRCVLALWLAVSPALPAAGETDPLLRLEHGLWLQEVQWDVIGAMREYQAAISLPGANARVLAEARFHLAGCFLEKDCPSAALALYQTIVRVHSDVPPFGRLASEKLTDTAARIERNPQLPSRHVTSKLSERLLLLQSALKQGEGPLATLLIDAMREDLSALTEELLLVPTNEAADRASLRKTAAETLEAQSRVLAQVSAAIASADAATAIRLVTQDAALLKLLNRDALWPTVADWGRHVAERRTEWIRAIGAGDAAAVQQAQAGLRALLQPVSMGPRGNVEVQTALQTLEILQRMELTLRASQWTEARRQLADELTKLYHRYSPASTVRPPNAEELSPAMLTQLVSVLTHVVEAVDQIDHTSRPERALTAIDQAIATGRVVLSEWPAGSPAFQRLQGTLSQLERARTEAAMDLMRCRRLLRAEIYD